VTGVSAADAARLSPLCFDWNGDVPLAAMPTL